MKSQAPPPISPEYDKYKYPDLRDIKLTYLGEAVLSNVSLQWNVYLQDA